jgi:hypothetical protein
LTPCFFYDLTKPISQHFSYGLMRYHDHNGGARTKSSA